MQLPLWAQIQSLLFVRTDAVSFSWLASTLDVAKGDVRAAVSELAEQMSGQGIALVQHDETVILATHPDMAPLIDQLYTREITSPLSKAALETLAIILYKGPIQKSELDHIRGVNSQFMLRNLSVRGLIEKKENPEDKRRPLYQATHDTLTFLGVASIRELPEYDTCMQKLSELLDTLEVEE
jgi:segregation and condensation protein B